MIVFSSPGFVVEAVNSQVHHCYCCHGRCCPLSVFPRTNNGTGVVDSQSASRLFPSSLLWFLCLCVCACLYWFVRSFHGKGREERLFSFSQFPLCVGYVATFITSHLPCMLELKDVSALFCEEHIFLFVSLFVLFLFSYHNARFRTGSF